MNIKSAEYREQELNKLITFSKSTDNVLENVLSMFQWTRKNVDEKEEHYVTCPINRGHRLPEKMLQKHIDICRWTEEGYDQYDVELSEPTLSPDNPYTIKIDADLQAKILLMAKQKNSKMLLGVGDQMIPRTSNRIFSSFTSDERTAIYDYVIANTQKLNIGQDIADLNKTKEKKEEKFISYLDLLVQERNLKRRRAKHRGVHTNKKSHVEVLREVIEQQMEIFKEYLSEQDVQDGKEETVQKIIAPPEHSIMTDANYETTNYSPDRYETYFQREKKDDRHYKEDNRREYPKHQNESHHHSYKRDKCRSNEERYKSREREKYKDRYQDGSKDDRSRKRKKNKSKDRHRSRSNVRRELKHHEHKSRKRSRSRY
ncbi:U11/U12 small nuclear ribonucleoprotein 48 kDa protein-like isoform X2 [Leptopilina boulardi]|uniref:U11/U12 small nuclear ribonucleoprotein 48 kDa protein-like isoform X2 n=1 Tax=Leptopilina boulardi TaxID=63433 RepID=UPI0021F6064E|nr:U11/U12 small nuclear ribonucleoprotein 48 kDa protein-like isoform X2 [Leptopilina boulardi]